MNTYEQNLSNIVLAAQKANTVTDKERFTRKEHVPLAHIVRLDVFQIELS